MSEKQDLQQKIDELSKEYAKTKYNKATDKYLGILRAKIAKMNRILRERKRQKGIGYAVKKTGDATVAIVGPPNVGKSSLISSITNADSKVASYAFTTVDIIPGMLTYKGANIQLLDLPGLIEGMHIGRGGGRKVSSVIRVADLALFVVDGTTYDILPNIIDELASMGIKVNKRPKSIRIERRQSGGISIEGNGKRVPAANVVKEVLNDFGIYNAEVAFFDDADVDDLIELLSGSTVYIKGIAALNKIDMLSSAAISEISGKIADALGSEPVCISVHSGKNIEELKEAIFKALGLIRVYLKPKDGAVDAEKPVIAKQGSTVADVAKVALGRKANAIRYAIITGKSVRFTGKVGLEHVLADGDIITFA